jgi:hypothetical protein
MQRGCKWLLVLTLLAAPGCAGDAGHGFATLSEVRVQLALEPEAARTLGDRTLLTNLYYELTLDEARLALDQVVLLQAQAAGSGESAAFDPARPPTGYSFCHGGHCHADDGSLVPYEEVQARQAAGGSVTAPVAALPADVMLDLWTRDAAALREVTPSRELPRATISQLSLSVANLTLTGSVRGGPADAGIGELAVPIRIRFASTFVIAAPYQLAIDREEPGEFSLDVAGAISARIFDDVDFAAWLSEGSVVLEDPQDEALARLVAAFAGAGLGITRR